MHTCKQIVIHHIIVCPRAAAKVNFKVVNYHFTQKWILSGSLGVLCSGLYQSSYPNT